MPIIRTAQTSNFTFTPNAIANDESLSGVTTAILIYLISKPPHWRFNARDIKRRFNIGLNKVYRCMRELIQAGYATYKRVQSAVEWFIYDTPQNKETATRPAVIDRVNFERVQNEYVLERTDLLEKNTTTPEAPIPDPIPAIPVVVFSESEELVYPAQLNTDQKKAVKAIIKKVKQPELQQPVLFALAYALINGSIKSSVPGYLNSLVTAANNGTFTAVDTASASKQGGKPLIPIWQGFRPSAQSKPEVAYGFINQAKAALRGMNT